LSSSPLGAPSRSSSASETSKRHGYYSIASAIISMTRLSHTSIDIQNH
jgi:hypothetical protein